MLEFFLSYLLVYTYLVLFLVAAIASFLIPLPITALLMASWAFAAQGYLDFRLILLSSLLWCVLWDFSWYLISYFHGKDILFRIGFKKIINSPKFIELERIFSKNSIKSILLTRFLITGLGSSVNILSWLTKIGHKKFFFFDILWEIIYVTIFASLGFILWNEWQYIASTLEDFLTILVLIILLVILIRFIFWNKKK